ncbi:EpsI family protein [Pseudoduganella sp. FT26W]|uniref:EpsI family protein n=1 Tax=Duganella aquatilis TaxID=2666082 RepID=A0A844D5T1_9BURK|nr:exosortase-associated protein EpsI, B-type [Duganella aquatilis]MRW86261.1 EpsI family protein [Duganella aquatilis]
MNRTLRLSLVAGVLMVSSAVLAKIMTPTERLAQVRAPLVLDTAIPTSFGDWIEEKDLTAQVINPETADALAKIYTQTLSRNYVNRDGERIMLSIAYGEDQTSGLQLHYPEVCYPAQGFNLASATKGTLTTHQGVLRVKRLQTSLGSRNEPVTYWTTMADKVVLGGYDTKFAQLSYGLRGQIPDGLIFRVSSISNDPQQAFKVQDDFVRQIADALPVQSRSRFIGTPGQQ